MNYIGFDISKYKHDCFIATETESFQFSFENNQAGFKELLGYFKPLVKQEMIIGLEATGHYGENLKSFLTLMDMHSWRSTFSSEEVFRGSLTKKNKDG